MSRRAPLGGRSTLCSRAGRGARGGRTCSYQLPCLCSVQGDARAEGGHGAPCGAPCDNRAERKALVSCRGYLRPAARCARGQRPRMPPLGPPMGLSGAAPAMRHVRRSPHPGRPAEAQAVATEACALARRRNWVAQELAAGGRERPRACRMPSFNARGRPGAGEGPNHTAQRRRRGGLARLVPRCDRAASGAKPTGALLIAPARGNAARGVRMSNTPFGSGGGSLRWGA